MQRQYYPNKFTKLLNHQRTICITGPESCGKTTLAHALSIRLEATMVPEIAREYVESLDRPYHQQDLDAIALLSSNAYQQDFTSRIRIVDCDFLTLKIWSEEVYGHCSNLILESYENFKPDLYLLMYPDLPWEPDPLRENEFDRERLFDVYKKELEKSNRVFQIVRGVEDQRYHQAESAISDLCKNKL